MGFILGNEYLLSDSLTPPYMVINKLDAAHMRYIPVCCSALNVESTSMSADAVKFTLSSSPIPIL